MLPIGKPIISIEKLIRMNIGIKIRRLREQEKLSQFELAERLGIAQATLSSIESGETKKVDFELMDKICKEFDVDFEYFTSEIINNVEKAEYSNIGYNNGIINNISEKLIEQYEERIKELKQVIEDLRSR